MTSGDQNVNELSNFRNTEHTIISGNENMILLIQITIKNFSGTVYWNTEYLSVHHLFTTKLTVFFIRNNRIKQ